MRIVCAAALLALSGCSAQLSSKLGALEEAVNNGGPITPITNLSSTLLLQEWQVLHNLMIGMQQVDQASGMVAVTMAPPIVAQTGPTVVMPTTPVTVVPSSVHVTVVPPPPVTAPAPVPVP
jgi:hypothetical protein